MIIGRHRYEKRFFYEQNTDNGRERKWQIF